MLRFTNVVLCSWFDDNSAQWCCKRIYTLLLKSEQVLFLKRGKNRQVLLDAIIYLALMRLLLEGKRCSVDKFEPGVNRARSTQVRQLLSSR